MRGRVLLVIKNKWDRVRSHHRSPLLSVIFSWRWEILQWHAELQVRRSATRNSSDGGLMLLSMRVVIWPLNYFPWPLADRPLTIRMVAIKGSVVVDGELTFRSHAQWSHWNVGNLSSLSVRAVGLWPYVNLPKMFKYLNWSLLIKKIIIIKVSSVTLSHVVRYLVYDQNST